MCNISLVLYPLLGIEILFSRIQYTEASVRGGDGKLNPDPLDDWVVGRLYNFCRHCDLLAFSHLDVSRRKNLPNCLLINKRRSLSALDGGY